MKAIYRGHCVWCDNPIALGEDIHRVGGRWIHEDCPDRCYQPDPVRDAGNCRTCRKATLLVHHWGKDGYCRECWNELAENMESDYGHIHDIYDMPF